MKKTNGKYASAASRTVARKQKHKKKSKLIPILCILLVLSALVFGAVLWLTIRQSRNSNHFQELAAQVQAVEQTRVTQPPAPAQNTPAPTEAPQGAAQPQQTQPPQETEPAVKTIMDQYAGLYQQNTDFFGWIKIPGTKVDYPVMHSPDEAERYLHADFNRNYSYAGTPFLKATCTADSDNLLIYGHNMLDGSMFRSLLKYENKSYWEEHPTIQFNTLYEEQEFEILAAFYDRVYYKTETVFKFYQFIDAEDEADFDYAVSQFKEKSLYDTGITAEYGDQLITLITCAYHTSNGRFVVVAVKK